MATSAWLESLIETVANCSESQASPFKIGYRYSEDGGFWEVLVYLIPVQLVGGAEGGAIISRGSRGGPSPTSTGASTRSSRGSPWIFGTPAPGSPRCLSRSLGSQKSSSFTGHQPRGRITIKRIS